LRTPGGHVLWQTPFQRLQNAEYFDAADDGAGKAATATAAAAISNNARMVFLPLL
jgi:hypothetical protein